jgi:CTP-dependent riboflavin kinase
METKRINKTKSWFFEKISKIDKSLAKITKRKIEKTQINKIRNEKGDIITIISEILRVIREYFEDLYSIRLENLEEIDKSRYI